MTEPLSDTVLAAAALVNAYSYIDLARGSNFPAKFVHDMRVGMCDLVAVVERYEQAAKELIEARAKLARVREIVERGPWTLDFFDFDIDRIEEIEEALNG